MELILKTNEDVGSIIGLQDFRDELTYEFSPYLVKVEYDEKILLYNTLTYELISLELNEYKELNSETEKWLIAHWFMFPKDVFPKSISYLLRSCLSNKSIKKTLTKINSSVIMTTMACNARCFYCYESGRITSSMSEETALNVAKYLKDNASELLHVSWFGGEPLCNPDAINTICNYLTENGVRFYSSMITNGYLMNEHSIKELKEVWRLRKCQISIDGTKENYSLAKRYVNGDVNAFDRVLDNIQTLIENNITVAVRLNVSPTNGDDLLSLVNILKNRFSNNKKILAYCHVLFDGSGDPPLNFTDEEKEAMFDNVIKIEKALVDAKMNRAFDNLSNIKKSHCIADSGTGVVINTEGKLTLCEHYSDSEFIGSVNNNERDYDMINSWKQRSYDECDNCVFCFYYPQCYRLKKCPTEPLCTYNDQKLMKYKIERSMIDSYNKHKNVLMLSSK